MRKKPYLIGITGGSGSGKTTIAQNLNNLLTPNCALIAEDDYYFDTSKMAGFDAATFDFDTPLIRDHNRLFADLSLFLNELEFQQPIYDFVTHSRIAGTKTIAPCDYLIIEGTHVLHNPQIRELLDLKIFVDTDESHRFNRRLERDIKERGRTEASVVDFFARCVKPGHDKWTEPTRIYADLVLDCNPQNDQDERMIINRHINEIIERINLHFNCN